MKTKWSLHTMLMKRPAYWADTLFKGLCLSIIILIGLWIIIALGQAAFKNFTDKSTTIIPQKPLIHKSQNPLSIYADQTLTDSQFINKMHQFLHKHPSLTLKEFSAKPISQDTAKSLMSMLPKVSQE